MQFLAASKKFEFTSLVDARRLVIEWRNELAPPCVGDQT
jgi:hypothetical protein